MLTTEEATILEGLYSNTPPWKLFRKVLDALLEKRETRRATRRTAMLVDGWRGPPTAPDCVDFPDPPDDDL